MTLTAMPKYKAYKDSGVEWLSNIPAHWQPLANKHIFKIRKTLVGKRSKQYDLLSLTLRGVIKRDMENPEGKFPAEFDTYQEVNSGDFVFCLFDVEETPRTVGLSQFNGMITGAYTVFEVDKSFDKKFLYYFYLNLDQGKRLKPLYRGLRNTIPKDAFMAFKTFIPPQWEQTAIANFLDVKTTQIDEAIAIKEQQIALLNERKQILIQQAVTQGLDPTVPMKDSGVEWIGKIPEHWEVIKLKHIFSEVNCRTKTGEETLFSLRMEIGLVPHNDVSDKPIPPESLVDYKIVQTGQLVMNRMRAAIGIFGLATDKGLVSPDYAVFDMIKDINDEFFLTLFKSPLMKTQFRLSSQGMGTGSSGFMRLYTDSFGNIKVSIPPKSEQDALMEFIDKINDSTSSTINHLEVEINSLKEYKTTLINSAVTGKIKVV